MEANEIFQGILDRDHPSFGTRNAVFMFALVGRDGVSRFILVEANNSYAVLTIERILLQDQRVSDNCHMVAIFRDNRNLGTRGDLIEEVPYVDFMTDIVESGRILEDSVMIECFTRSLTPQEKIYASAKLRELARQDSQENVLSESLDEREAEEAPELEEEQESTVPSHDEEKAKSLQFALINMGFKKALVIKFVDSLGSDLDSKTLPELVRRALAELSTNKNAA